MCHTGYMCGRYATMMSRTDVQLAFDTEAFAEGLDELRPNWNVAPTQLIPVVLERPLQEGDDVVVPTESLAAPAEGEAAPLVRAVNLAHWGLIPPWAKDASMGARMINARMETVAEKRSFAANFKKRRCIIPASGYYEWKKVGNAKQPYFIQRADGEPMGLAGLYGWWKTPEEDWLLTCTILTREAEGEMRDIHDRVTVFLEKSEYDAWLDPSLTDPDEVHSIIARPNSRLTVYPVRREVGNVRNNSPENVEEISL